MAAEDRTAAVDAALAAVGLANRVVLSNVSEDGRRSYKLECFDFGMWLEWGGLVYAALKEIAGFSRPQTSGCEWDRWLWDAGEVAP